MRMSQSLTSFPCRLITPLENEHVLNILLTAADLAGSCKSLVAQNKTLVFKTSLVIKIELCKRLPSAMETCSALFHVT